MLFTGKEVQFTETVSREIPCDIHRYPRIVGLPDDNFTLFHKVEPIGLLMFQKYRISACKFHEPAVGSDDRKIVVGAQRKKLHRFQQPFSVRHHHFIFMEKNVDNKEITICKTAIPI
jgi:hypothetical protein